MTKAEMDFKLRTIKSERDLLAMQLVEERARTRRLRGLLVDLLPELTAIHIHSSRRNAIVAEARAALKETK